MVRDNSVYMQEKVQEVKNWLGSGSVNIFGAPFSGKDTQGRILARLLSAPLLGGGDILRNSTIPEHVREAMHKGELIPTEDYLQIVLPYLSKKEFENKPLVLSSVGRWIGEEKGVISATRESNHPLKIVVSLEIDERFIWRRFQDTQKQKGHPRGKRHDDEAEILEVRLEEYGVKTLPVVNFYKDLGLLITIDASANVEDVTTDLINKIYTHAKSA